MELLKRRRGRAKQNIEQEIRAALDDMRPILRLDECALSLASFDGDTGLVMLNVKGGCTECDVSVATFIQGIETQLRLRVPEIAEVHLIGEER
jgi:Fe-S cluster biogenesis protein NfuA